MFSDLGFFLAKKNQTRGKHFSVANTGENVFEFANTCEKVRLMGGIFQLANTGEMFSDVGFLAKNSDSWEAFFGCQYWGECFRTYETNAKIGLVGSIFQLANRGGECFRTCENLRNISDYVASFTAAAKTHRRRTRGEPEARPRNLHFTKGKRSIWEIRL